MLIRSFRFETSAPRPVSTAHFDHVNLDRSNRPRGSWPSSRWRRPFQGTLLSLLFASLCLVSFTISGCGTSGVRLTGEKSADGLSRVRIRRPGSLYIKPEHHIGKYDFVQINQIGFGYKDGQDRLSETDEERIRGMMINDIVALATVGGQVGLTKNAGPCVLGINVYLNDLEFYDTRSSGSSSAIISSFGQATLIFELRDSTSQEPLARFFQRRSLGGGNVVGSSGPDLDRLAATLDKMTVEVGEQLIEVMPDSQGDQAHSCESRMAWAARGRTDSATARRNTLPAVGAGPQPPAR